MIFSDSAATSGHHVGETPDVRAQLACRKRGLDIKEHRAREIAPEDFAKFDLILVMDWENLTDLQHRSPPQFKHKIHLLMRYANDYDAAIMPDPYYGLNEGFNQVLDYCTDACGGLLETLERKPRDPSRPFRPRRPPADPQDGPCIEKPAPAGFFALMGGFLACKFCPPFCVDSIIDLISRVFFANIRPTWSGFGHSPVISRHSTPVKLELHLEADDQRTICRHGHGGPGPA